MAKQLYNWGKVKAGDIISFRYKSKDNTAKLTTLLVLNQRLKFKKKNGQLAPWEEFYYQNGPASGKKLNNSC